MFELREVDGYMGALQCLIPLFYNSAAQTNKRTDQSLNLISTKLIYKKLDSDTCIFFFKIQRKRQKKKIGRCTWMFVKFTEDIRFPCNISCRHTGCTMEFAFQFQISFSSPLDDEYKNTVCFKDAFIF